MVERDFDLVEPADDASGAEKGLTLRDVIAAIRRRWWAVAAAFALVVAVSMWRTLRMPRLYRAAATVRIQPHQPPIPGMMSGGPAVDYRVDRLLSEQQVIKSLEVAQRAVERLGLHLAIVRPARVRRSALFGDVAPVVDSAITAADFRLHLGDREYILSSGHTRYGSARYGEPVAGGGIRVVVPERPDVEGREVVLVVIPLLSAAAHVRSGIVTRVVPQTDIVEISYLGTDPPLVRDIVNTIARSFADFSAEMQKSNARRKSDFIRASIDSQAKVLAEKQRELQDFKERYQTADVSAEQMALFETIRNFEADKRAAHVEQSVYRDLVGKLSQADTADADLRQLAGTPAITQNQYIANLYTNWFGLSKARDDLIRGRGIGPSHPEVEALERDITRLKREIQTASGTYLRALDSKIASLDANIGELRQQGERYPPLEARQAQLMANVRTAQATYDELQSRYQLARIEESADVGSVRLIDEAILPSYAVSPNRRRALMMAMALGLLLGVGLAVLLERLDDSVKSPDELRDRMNLPVLGLVPAIEADDADGDGGEPAVGRLVAHADPRAPVSEAFRSLRTNLAFARANQRLRTIVLTSPGPADGKSTTVANLAITFAQQGQRTLLIDGDLRRAVLDRTFGVPRSPGLTELIVGAATAEEAIHETKVPGLFVLGSGQFPPNPSELLGSSAMRDILRMAQERFDIVLLDSPPLLAVTDAAVLSTMVDGTLLVVRMGSTAREAVRRALSHLSAVHARVVGALLNDVNFKDGAYYGGYGYYYYRYYGSEAGGNGRRNGLLGRLRTVARLRSRERQGR